jgi:hypothetical protein
LAEPGDQPAVGACHPPAAAAREAAFGFACVARAAAEPFAPERPVPPPVKKDRPFLRCFFTRDAYRWKIVLVQTEMKK